MEKCQSLLPAPYCTPPLGLPQQPQLNSDVYNLNCTRAGGSEATKLVFGPFIDMKVGSWYSWSGDFLSFMTEVHITNNQVEWFSKSGRIELPRHNISRIDNGSGNIFHWLMRSLFGRKYTWFVLLLRYTKKCVAAGLADPPICIGWPNELHQCGGKASSGSRNKIATWVFSSLVKS